LRGWRRASSSLHHLSHCVCLSSKIDHNTAEEPSRRNSLPPFGQCYHTAYNCINHLLNCKCSHYF
jgi:hypothetical protein